MRRMLLLSSFLLVIALAFSGTMRPASAQDVESTPPGFIGPPELWPPPSGLRVEYQRVDVTITDQVAVTRVEQLFVNDNDWMMEGTYLFPLPAGAAVNELTMWIDGVPIEAKILGAGEARAIYDEIVRQLRDPALLEYVGMDAVQANVFPIPPHEERRIAIEYSQILASEGGLIRYVYPQSTNLYTNMPLENQSIRVEIQSNEAIRTVYSPSHQVAVDRPTEFSAIAGYEEELVYPDRDFELYYSVSPDEIGLNLLSYKEAGQDGFFLLLVSPTVEVDPATVVSKDVILVVDTSGSMDGEKLAQAKAATRYVVEHLNPNDRFNIVSFSTGTRNYAADLIPASEPGDYVGFIDSLEAIGGTNISQALLEAANLGDGERPTTVLFLTDGLATEGIVETDLLLSTVTEAMPDSTRLFAFGVGDDVDTFVLDSLAQEHRGTTVYVRPGEPIDEAVSGFYAKISTPVLADIALDFGGIAAEQLYPADLPDLFAGTQLVIAGRYREGGPATITLTGDVNGEQQTFAYEDQRFSTSGGDAFIPRLWATRAIGNLLTQIRLHGEDPELVQSIVNLSIRYGIITPYTSYLIEEEDIFTQAGREMIIEEAAQGLSAPAPVSGAEAVEEAAAEADLAEAEAPLFEFFAPPAVGEGEIANAPANAPAAVQVIGARTFVFRDGVWIDTAYDADRHTPQQLGFAGEAYFELLEAAPELGPVLALGERVLVVYGDVAYEIVPGEGDTDVTIPTAGQGNTPISDSGELGDPSTENGESMRDESQAPASGACIGAFILPLFLGVLAGGFASRNRRRRNQSAY